MIDIDRLAEQIYFSVLAHGQAHYPSNTTGYSVQNIGIKTVYPMSSFNPRTIANFMQYNFIMTGAESLGCVFSVDLTPDKRAAILDVITITPDRTEARMLALSRGLRVFYDIDNSAVNYVLVKGRDGKNG